METTSPAGAAGLRAPSWRWAAIALAVVALAFGVQRWRRSRSGAQHPRSRPASRAVGSAVGPSPDAAFGPAANTPPAVPLRTPDDAAVDPLTTAERALFAPLVEGATVGPATVVRIEGMRNGALSIQLRVRTVAQTFRVAKAEGSRVSHPVGPYTVYMVGAGSEWTRAEMEQTWQALDAVILRNAGLPIPPGMQSANEPATTTVRVDWRL